jgi:hypothetical protein
MTMTRTGTGRVEPFDRGKYLKIHNGFSGPAPQACHFASLRQVHEKQVAHTPAFCIICKARRACKRVTLVPCDPAADPAAETSAKPQLQLGRPTSHTLRLMINCDQERIIYEDSQKTGSLVLVSKMCTSSKRATAVASTTM